MIDYGCAPALECPLNQLGLKEMETVKRRRSRFLLLGPIVLFALVSMIPYPKAQGAETVIRHHRFSHSEGFVVTQVAAPPLVERPIEIAFDEAGRLYCTDSAGVNDPVQQQLSERPHRVLRLEDTDGDGVFDHQVVFADQMMFPEGCLWYAGSLYVAAPPSIWKLTDTDGDGVADQRVEWFKGQTLTGCANDLHGPYLGLDGWIYWTKGAFAEQTYSRSDGSVWTTRAAHLFRSDPEAKQIEPVMSGGMDNPVGVTFGPGGERFFTTTFFQHPGGGKRDGLVHAIYGGLYGKDHGVLEGHVRTGPLMPVLTHLGAAAPAGLTRYRSSRWGAEYEDNLFSALFNLQRVMRHQLQVRGATYTSDDEVFLQSDNRNFHPTDVEEDADGSLLVVDTGGWYKLCCPTSQLPKPDVLGGIYRVSRRDAPVLESPRGENGLWARMEVHRALRLLDDPRPAVGDRLVEFLGRSGSQLLAALGSVDRGSLSALGQRRLVWSLSRIGSQESLAVVRSFLRADEGSVRMAAIHTVGLHRDSLALTELSRTLMTDTVPHRRAAAEALGRLRDARAIPLLLGQLQEWPHRVFRHSLLYALVEIGEEDSIARGLEADEEGVRLGALLALDQLKSGRRTGEHLVRLLKSPDPEIRETAIWVLGQRPSHGTAALSLLRAWIERPQESGLDRGDLVRLLAKLGSNEDVARLLGEILVDRQRPLAVRSLVLSVLAMSREGTISSWQRTVAALIEHREMVLLSEAIAAAVRLDQLNPEHSGLLKALMRLSVDSSIALPERLQALGVVIPHLKSTVPEQFAAILEGIQLFQPARLRSVAGGALQQARLGQQQRLLLARHLDRIGPMEMPSVLSAFGKGSHERIGKAFLSGLADSPGLAAVSLPALETALENYPPELRAQGKSVLDEAEGKWQEQRAQLQDLLRHLPTGDIRRGQAVFNSERAACASCHEIGYLGGNVGPDLTRIGRVRSREDLLESVVFPNLSFVRSYEPYQIITTDGNQWNGIIRDDDGRTMTVVTGPGQSVRIDHDAIEQQIRSEVSLMPSGMGELLSREELADLLAFLEATRW